MSAPIDIPQNINLHLTHTERVVQTPKPDTQDNSSYQFSFELQNKASGSERREEIAEKKRRKQEKDSYEGHTPNQQREDTSFQQEETPALAKPSIAEEPEVLSIGKNLDVSA